MSAPERIWLQAGANRDDVDITWCVDKVNDDDTEYVRVDLIRRQMSGDNPVGGVA